jgi:chromate reductase
MPETPNAAVKILGLCGSPRAQSYNLAALKTAGELMPEGMTMEIGSIRELPLYDADLQAKGFPEAVMRLADQVRAADAVLIASPEYNYSVPGVLKNAIDWVSRVKDQPFNDKPVAVMGASMGALGTGRMQYDLRKIMLFLNANTLVKPEIFIGSAQTKFDEQGRLTDEPTRKFIAEQMEALRRWALRINGSRQAAA